MQNDQQQPQYQHIYPFRFVRPYKHIYRTFAKGRWLKRQLLEVLIKQFKAYDPQYYQNAVETGKIKINGQIVSTNYIIKNGDQILHEAVREQPPVLDLDIDIICENDDFLIINKPPSMIVHTGGGHHFNTVESILHFEKKYNNLHVLHRLDKCTSGLLFFAKDKSKVQKFHDQSGKQIMKKMYFARVAGQFPWQQKQLRAIIECISHKDGIYKVSKQILQQEKIQNKDEKCQEQIKQLKNKKISQKKADEQQFKDSKTLFKRVWYDERSDSSLLECYPITGRTHQIRVHLQYLGFPILNDVGYGGRFIGNQIISQIQKPELQKQEQYDQREEVLGHPKKRRKLNQEYYKAEDWDYLTRPWEIMLHSYRYIFEGKTYTSKPPYWIDKNSIPTSNK